MRIKNYQIVWREVFLTAEEASEAYRRKRSELFGDKWRD